MHNPNFCNLQAEKSTLGALMLNNKTLKQVASLINEQDFSLTENRLIFRAIESLIFGR